VATAEPAIAADVLEALRKSLETRRIVAQDTMGLEPSLSSKR
jgi:hypothetical protein